MNPKFLAIFLAFTVVACGGRSNVTTRNSQSNGTASNGSGNVVVAAGTDFYGRLQHEISTKTSHDGDTFSLVHTDTFFHKNPALNGSAIDGHLENVRPAGTMRKPSLTLVFDDIRMADGTKAPIDVKLESMKVFEPRTHHFRTIGLMIGGAIAGHEFSKHTGKRHGALLGAAGGYALSQTMKTDIVVPAGTVIEVKFQQPARAGAAGG
jgi:hypothetical protein